MLHSHRQNRGVATILSIRMDKEQANHYGCLVHDPETGEVLHFVEKPGMCVSSKSHL